MVCVESSAFANAQLSYKLESRAEAHTAAAIDVVVVEEAAVEVRAPRAARAALRRRPVVVREAFT